MPLVAHNALPTFDRLRRDGITVLSTERAANQEIRELHVGLLNMMPDAALEATERQFYRLVGESNPIAQFYMHPFTLPTLPRGEAAQAVESGQGVMCDQRHRQLPLRAIAASSSARKPRSSRTCATSCEVTV
jgi:hypothetical protein